MTFLYRRHRRVVESAHYVLAKGVEAVEDVFFGDELRLRGMGGEGIEVGFADVFLGSVCEMMLSNGVIRFAYQAMHMMEPFYEIQPL